MQKLITLTLSFACIAFLSACGPKLKEVSKVDEANAVQQAETAKRELAIRNFDAAEKALTNATKLNPNNDEYWFDLAILRARANNKSGARDAYKEALSICEIQAKLDPKTPIWHIKQLRPLILLGRVDDARAVLANAVKVFPADANIQALNQQKIVDVLLADPQLKEFSAK